MGIFLYITPKASVRGCIGMEVPERLNWNDSTCVFHDSILVQIPVQKKKKKGRGLGGGGGRLHTAEKTRTRKLYFTRIVV